MPLPPHTPFGGIEGQTDDLNQANIVVLPLCYEQASSYGEGSGQGLYHILGASRQLEALDEETGLDWRRCRIHTLAPLIPPFDPEMAIPAMQKAARAVLARNKFLLSLGGDHAVCIGPIMAAAEKHAGLGVLQIDAHLDLRDEWHGSRYNHACVMRRVVADMGLAVAQVGIRSFSPEEYAFVQAQGLTPFYAHAIYADDDSWMDQAIGLLPQKVYLTLDLDGLDPGVLPGTGTPEPGGLTYRQLVRLLQKVGQQREVVAADINELVKIKGTRVSEYTAAKIATKIFIYCFAGL